MLMNTAQLVISKSFANISLRDIFPTCRTEYRCLCYFKLTRLQRLSLGEIWAAALILVFGCVCTIFSFKSKYHSSSLFVLHSCNVERRISLHANHTAVGIYFSVAQSRSLNAARYRLQRFRHFLSIQGSECDARLSDGEQYTSISVRQVWQYILLRRELRVLFSKDPKNLETCRKSKYENFWRLHFSVLQVLFVRKTLMRVMVKVEGEGTQVWMLKQEGIHLPKPMQMCLCEHQCYFFVDIVHLRKNKIDWLKSKSERKIWFKFACMIVKWFAKMLNLLKSNSRSHWKQKQIVKLWSTELCN